MKLKVVCNITDKRRFKSVGFGEWEGSDGLKVGKRKSEEARSVG